MGVSTANPMNDTYRGLYFLSSLCDADEQRSSRRFDCASREHIRTERESD
ncbi:unnamed protein product [Ectocarpus sp. 8 AP-2014]